MSKRGFNLHEADSRGMFHHPMLLLGRKYKKILLHYSWAGKRRITK